MRYWKKFWPLYLLTAIVFVFAALGTDSAVSTIAENIPIAGRSTVIIDAGHGGVDGGATSCSGALESHINLQIALRLDDLCHLLGYRTRMIRTTDISVYTEGNTIAAKKASDLRHRVRIVNETKDAILISIHQNTYSDSRYSGAQVFYAGSSGSKELAELLQNEYFSLLQPQSNRRAKPASGVYLMQHIEKTGILVECGFLSNPEEEARLRNDDYQKQLCCLLICGLGRYINT